MPKSRFYIKSTLLVVFLCWASVFYGQSLYPLTYSYNNYKSTPKKIIDGSLRLPLFDDFNKISNQADTAIWEVNSGVYVNNAFAKNPPSLGVATFDGISSDGTPYNIFEPSAFGSTDQLVSKPIDLTTDNANVYLSFYYQPTGNGHVQINEGDSLKVYLLDSNQTWKSVWSAGIDSVDVFEQVFIPITDAKYFYKDFKFRLSAFGNRSGMYDIWNIDYVYINSNRDTSDVFFKDIAISTKPQNLLKNYSAMPYNQFLVSPETELNDSLSILINDFKDNNGLPIPIRKKMVLTELFSNTSFEIFDTTDLINNGERDFPISTKGENLNLFTENAPMQIETKFTITTSDPTKGDTLVAVIKDSLLTDIGYIYVGVGDFIRIDDIIYDLEATDVVFVDSGSTVIFQNDTVVAIEDKNLNLIGKLEQFTTSHNDSVVAITYLTDFFAYDDGTAEKTFVMDQQYGVTAIRFDLNTSDTITGVEFYLPNCTRAQNGETIELVIWKDLNGFNSSVDSILHTEPMAAYVEDTLNKFTLLRLEKDIAVSGHFYVGWLVTGEGETHFGFDANSTSEGKIYVKKEDTWSVYAKSGAIMLRPIMANDRYLSVNEFEVNKISVKIYPNPAQEMVHFSERAERATLYNSKGVLLADCTNCNELLVDNFENGIYFIQFVTTKGVDVQKLSILK